MPRVRLRAARASESGSTPLRAGCCPRSSFVSAARADSASRKACCCLTGQPAGDRFRRRSPSGDGRAGLLSGEGWSGVSGAKFHRIGFRSGGEHVRGRARRIESVDRDPKFRNVRWEENPDLGPESESPAPLDERAAQPPDQGEPASGGEYLGALGEDRNWQEQWTCCGPESNCDTRDAADGGQVP